MDIWERLFNAAGFEWDEGNVDKNWEKHEIRAFECEQVFFNRPIVVKDDEKHSRDERRFFALGRTDAYRLIFIVFTLRKERIRVISATPMSRRELEVFKKHE